MANTKIPSELSSTPSISDSGNATAIAIDSSENVTLSNDLTVDTSTLKVDSTNNRVGVGTVNPSTPLDVVGSTGIRVNEDGSGTKVINIRSDFAGVDPAINVSTNHALLLQTNNTERMRITNSGNVGIGTTSPDGKTDIAQAQNTTAASFTTPHLALTATGTTNTTGFTGISYASSTLTNYGWTVGSQRTGTGGSSGAFVLRYHNNSAAGYELGRFDSTNLKLGRTSGSISAEEQGVVINKSGYMYLARDGSSSATVIAFARNTDTTATTAGVITCNSGTSTVYGTSSDYRLKENVSYDWDATTRLKQLKPARFNFIADADTTVDGFLAHEVSDIVPEAIVGEKDGTESVGNVLDADGNISQENVRQSETVINTDAGETWQETTTTPLYQHIDQSKIVPLLVKTIQELEARITTLENA